MGGYTFAPLQSIDDDEPEDAEGSSEGFGGVSASLSLFAGALAVLLYTDIIRGMPYLVRWARYFLVSFLTYSQWFGWYPWQNGASVCRN
jgi:hypothetical protein